MKELTVFAAIMLAPVLCAAEVPELAERPEDLAALADYMKSGSAATSAAYSKALEAAGKNREQIEKAVDLCKTRREKLAMVWLVSGLEGKFFSRLEDREWKRMPDLESLTAEHLFHNVRYALAARDRFPWCRDLPWETFLGFVLPHRLGLEKAEDFRPALWELLITALEGVQDARSAVLAVNEFAASRVKLVKRDPQELGILEILEAGGGRNEDRANFAAACAITAGLPCAIAFTPWWGKGDGGSAWNEILLDGKWRSFEGCEPEKDGDPFDRVKERSTFSKVFRRLFNRRADYDDIYGLDVTAEYTRTAEVTIMGLRPDLKSCRLAVYNSGGWRVISSARIDEGGKAVFKDVGCREPVLYSAWVSGAEAQPACPPFLLAPDGSREFFAIDPIEPGTIGLRDLKISALLPNTNAGVAYFNGRQWMLVSRAVVDISGEADFGKTGRDSTLYVMVRIYGERLIPQGRPFSVKYDGDNAVVTRH